MYSGEDGGVAEVYSQEEDDNDGVAGLHSGEDGGVAGCTPPKKQRMAMMWELPACTPTKMTVLRGCTPKKQTMTGV